MRLFLTALVLIVPAWAGDSQLTDDAKHLLRQPGGRTQAEALLQQAVSQDPNNPEPLTLYAVLRQADLKDNPDELRIQVEPLLQRLLMVRRQTPGTKPADLALALELNAALLQLLSRPDEATPLKAQAQGLRKEIVREIHGADRAPGEAIYKIAPSQGISVPAVQQKIDPEYSEVARLAKVSGTVLLSVVIDTDGVARNIELSRGIGYGLDEKAAEAVSKWRFRPGAKDGTPVRVRAQIEVNFRLL